jgi:hypothetical protein
MSSSALIGKTNGNPDANSEKSKDDEDPTKKMKGASSITEFESTTENGGFVASEVQGYAGGLVVCLYLLPSNII